MKAVLAVVATLTVGAVLLAQNAGPVDYRLGPDSPPQTGVPKGRVTAVM
jgi:hypothetical protein